jgi:hypothetical protein
MAHLARLGVLGMFWLLGLLLIGALAKLAWRLLSIGWSLIP